MVRGLAVIDNPRGGNISCRGAEISLSGIDPVAELTGGEGTIVLDAGAAAGAMRPECRRPRARQRPMPIAATSPALRRASSAR